MKVKEGLDAKLWKGYFLIRVQYTSKTSLSINHSNPLEYEAPEDSFQEEEKYSDEYWQGEPYPSFGSSYSAGYAPHSPQYPSYPGYQVNRPYADHGIYESGYMEPFEVRGGQNISSSFGTPLQGPQMQASHYNPRQNQRYSAPQNEPYTGYPQLKPNQGYHGEPGMAVGPNMSPIHHHMHPPSPQIQNGSPALGPRVVAQGQLHQIPGGQSPQLKPQHLLSGANPQGLPPTQTGLAQNRYPQVGQVVKSPNINASSNGGGSSSRPIQQMWEPNTPDPNSKELYYPTGNRHQIVAPRPQTFASPQIMPMKMAAQQFRNQPKNPEEKNLMYYCSPIVRSRQIQPPQHAPGSPHKNHRIIKIQGLPDPFNHEMILNLCTQFGVIVSLKVVEAGKKFASFIQLYSNEQAVNTVQALNGLPLRDGVLEASLTNYLNFTEINIVEKKKIVAFRLPSTSTWTSVRTWKRSSDSIAQRPPNTAMCRSPPTIWRCLGSAPRAKRNSRQPSRNSNLDLSSSFLW